MDERREDRHTYKSYVPKHGSMRRRGNKENLKALVHGSIY
jgi:hypothetical protein